MAITKTGTSSYVATCDNCGKQIMNIFPIANKVYGSECIKKMTGQKPKHEQSVWVERWGDYQAYINRLQEEEVLEF